MYTHMHKGELYFQLLRASLKAIVNKNWAKCRKQEKYRLNWFEANRNECWNDNSPKDSKVLGMMGKAQNLIL